MDMHDTIAAIATGFGAGGIGIIRISGENALGIIRGISTFPGAEPEPYRLRHCSVFDPDTRQTIDQVLISYMPSPHSYTAEDVIEINCHGGRVIMQTILELCLMHGARLAEPGEFTKRAFLSGKLDLVQAEAVMDMIAAKTRQALQVAVSQLEGTLSQKIRQIRHSLFMLLATTEAGIDFPDDVPESDQQDLCRGVTEALQQIDELLEHAHGGQIVREGVAVAVIGLPNVGKSSLLNAILGVDRAIVSAVPGTTRDTIEEYCSIEGIPVKLIDTAGIRDIEHELEAEGIRRSRLTMGQAQVVLFMVDVSVGVRPEEKSLLSDIRERGKKYLIVANKTDLTQEGNCPPDLSGEPVVFTSITKRSGIEELKQTLKDLILGQDLHADVLPVSNPRHIGQLVRAQESLRNALETLSGGLTVDLVSIDLKGAVTALGEITGEDVTERVLDTIFSHFCIGK